MRTRPETLQPLIIYGNPLTPRTRREMSDLQHYPKLPPIRPDSAESEDGEATSEINQELTYDDITLDLGDIDVACVTERSVVGPENEVADDDQHVVYTPTGTTTDIPEAGTATSKGLDPSPRSGCQNPALLLGSLPITDISEDADKARSLSTRCQLGELADHDFNRHISNRRVPFTAPGYKTSTVGGIMNSEDRRKIRGMDKNKQNAILELSDGEEEQSVKDTAGPPDGKEKQQNFSKAPEIILTVPSVDMEDSHSLTAEQDNILRSGVRNGDENTNLNDVFAGKDDVLTKADDVSFRNDDVSIKNDDVLTKNVTDTDENSCDDDSVYSTDAVDYDDFDSDDNLLTLEEQEEQRLWDLEFEKRKNELVQKQENVETRRANYLSKLNNLTDRWNGIEARLENRQVEKRHQLYEQLQQLVTLHKRN